jgi:hypothetical protein
MTARGGRRSAFFVTVVVVTVTSMAAAAIACEPGAISPSGLAASEAAVAAAFDTPVPAARCGNGSLPETGLQGQVPLADRQSGRVLQPYRCNLTEVGHFQGQGSSWVSQSYGTCAYVATRSGATRSPGVQVLDVSDPREPKLTATLTTPAMLMPWESLKVNVRRGLLAAVSSPGPSGVGVAFFDLYDIATDCRHPRLLNALTSDQLSIPANFLGHEGNWAPDGNTYYATGYAALTAIDVRDERSPRAVYLGSPSPTGHGLSVSADGNRLFLAQGGNVAPSLVKGAALETGLDPNGLVILDTSEVQQRRANPQVRAIGSLFWKDGGVAQMTVPVSYDGDPYVLFADELLQGGVRIIDIGDEKHPELASKIKLAIHLPEHAAARDADTQQNGMFGYNVHYCSVDREVNPTAAACSYFESGVRVFDIRDPHRPREIAYYNPPAQVGRNQELDGSEHASGNGGALNQLSADWCSSPPRFVGRQLWVTCQDYGFVVLEFARGTYPLASPRTAALASGSGTARPPWPDGTLLALAVTAAIAGWPGLRRLRSHRARRPAGSRRRRRYAPDPGIGALGG